MANEIEKRNEAFLIYQDGNGHLHEFIQKGVTLDDDKLNGKGNRYFCELLQCIRDIRSSERDLYQQVTDIFITSIDYDPNANLTRKFFATVQNKLHYAAHQHTAAKVIYERVDAEKPMVGMTNFKGDYITRYCPKRRMWNNGSSIL